MNFIPSIFQLNLLLPITGSMETDVQRFVSFIMENNYAEQFEIKVLTGMSYKIVSPVIYTTVAYV
jgi:hypothetical protein